MKTEKPLHLISKLHEFLAETDKVQIGKVYIAIVEETKRITFLETPTNRFAEMVYKNLIRLAIKDYIHSGHSDESIKVLNEIIGIVSETEVIRE